MTDNKFEEIYWKPEYMNETVEGILSDIISNAGRYKNKLYILSNEDEKKAYCVWHKKDLEQMDKAKIGDYVIIYYKGEIETNQHTMQKYDVEIIEDPGEE